MTIAAIIRVVLFVLAGFALLFAFRSLIIGMRSRTAANKQYFNVGRLEARRKVFSSMLSTVGLVLLALVLAIGAALIPEDLFGGELILQESEEPNEPVVVEQPAEETEIAEQEPVIESGAMETGSEGEGEAVIEATIEETPIPTAIPTETPTPTPELKKIYVNSPIVGLYIRDLPEGDIIDVLDDQTPLSVLESSEEINGFTWIEVMTDDGRIGWVVEQFTTEVPPNLTPNDSSSESEG